MEGKWFLFGRDTIIIHRILVDSYLSSIFLIVSGQGKIWRLYHFSVSGRQYFQVSGTRQSYLFMKFSKLLVGPSLVFEYFKASFKLKINKILLQFGIRPFPIDITIQPQIKPFPKFWRNCIDHDLSQLLLFADELFSVVFIDFLVCQILQVYLSFRLDVKHVLRVFVFFCFVGRRSYAVQFEVDCVQADWFCAAFYGHAIDVSAEFLQLRCDHFVEILTDEDIDAELFSGSLQPRCHINIRTKIGGIDLVL